MRTRLNSIAIRSIFLPCFTNPANHFHYMYISDVDKKQDGLIPAKFGLDQNYPNPFNLVTAVAYQLSAVSEVTLTIYNEVGQKVATLLSELQTPGQYQIEWDARGFASGIYYYHLIAGEYREVKKMILLK